MITDIIQNITNYSFIQQQITLCQINKYVYNIIHIYKLKIKSRYRNIINQKIIEQKKFSRLIKLSATNVKKIYDVNHLANTLTHLECGMDSGIDQLGMNELKNIKKLVMKGNNRIRNLDKISDSLKYLDCSCKKNDGYEPCYNTVLEPDTFGKLKLDTLLATHCKNIPGNCFDNMSETLKKLNCDHSPCIDQHEISKLSNLEYLSCNNNREIYDVNHMKHTLRKLKCNSSGITQRGIAELSVLESLDCRYSEIHDVSFLSKTLVKLKCSPSFTQDMINKMTKLECITLGCNRNIKDFSHLNNTLVHLDLELNYVEFTQENLSKLNNLKTFISDRSNVFFDFNHLKNTLEIIKCRHTSLDSIGINQRGIKDLKKLRELTIYGSEFVDDVSVFADTLESLCLESQFKKNSVNGIHCIKNLKELRLYNTVVELDDFPNIYKSLQKFCNQGKGLGPVSKKNISKFKRLQSLYPNDYCF